MRSTAALTSSTVGMAPSAPTISILPDPSGPCCPGSVPTKIAASGTPSAAATCNRPVSTPTTNADARDHARDLIERLKVRHSGVRHRGCDLHAAPPLGFTAPWEHDREAILLERLPKRDPVCDRPFLLGPCGCVQQHRISPRRAAHQRRTIQSEIERAIRRITERLRGQHAIARDRVQRAIDLMMVVVEP